MLPAGAGLEAQGLGLEDKSAREMRRRRCPGRRRRGDEREQNGKQKQRKRERLEDSGRRSPSWPPAPDDSASVTEIRTLLFTAPIFIHSS